MSEATHILTIDVELFKMEDEIEDLEYQYFTLVQTYEKTVANVKSGKKSRFS